MDKRVTAIVLLGVSLGASLWAQAERQADPFEKFRNWEELDRQRKKLYDEAKYQEAFAVGVQAVRLAESWDTPTRILATSLNSLAILYQVQGDHIGALPLLQRALTIYEKLEPGTSRTAYSLNNLALLYRRLGDDKRASTLMQRALVIQERVQPDAPDTARMLANRAAMLGRQRDYAGAQRLYQRALSICEKVLPAEHLICGATISGSFGDFYGSWGEYDLALPLAQRSLRLREQALGPGHPGTATAVRDLAKLYRGQTDFERAMPLFQRAVTVFQKAFGAMHPDTALSIAELALTEIVQPQTHQQGCADLRQAIEIQIQITNRVAFGGVESALRQNLEQVWQQLGAAQSCLDGGFDLDLLFNYELATKGRGTEESRSLFEAVRRRATPEVSGLMERYIAAARRLSALEERLANVEERAEAENKGADLYRELVGRSPEFRVAFQAPTVQQIDAALRPGEGVVEIARYSPRLGTQWGPAEYGAFVLTKGTRARWISLGPAGNIDMLAEQFLALLEIPANATKAREIGSELYLLLIEKLKPALGGTRRVYFAPDGALAVIPWAALTASGEYLVKDELVLQLVGSGRDLLRWRGPGSQSPAGPDRIVADPDYGPGPLARLPGTLAEAQAIRAISKATIVQGAEATVASFSKMAGPRILHIATHGVYEGTGRAALNSSYLAMAGANAGPDGRLTARELSMINLNGTQLVVLSACESALGEVSVADGLMGFQRSLTLAGAHSQLLSLWRITDEVTAAFMKVFYTKLLVEGMSRADALRATQREFARAGHAPSEWAAFVLWGDPGRIDN